MHRVVQAVLAAGDGIVTGGALGVDFTATAQVLTYAPNGSRLQVFLPTPLDIYVAHYRTRADEGVITHIQAEGLIAQLKTVSQLGKLNVNATETEVTPRTYFARNTAVLNASDELLAFQVNNSAGTQDTIDKAKSLGIPVQIFKYHVG